MKKYGFILFAILLVGCFSLRADNDLFKDLSRYDFEHKYVETVKGNVANFQKFIGDTIIPEFKNVEYLKCVTPEMPDTIWLKKRPKKNPIQGKHYVLNNAYKGVERLGEFVTPVAELNGNEFIVFRVSQYNPVNYYESPSLILTLLEPETLNQVNLYIAETPDFSFDFKSLKASRLLQKYVGQDVYYAPEIKTYSVGKPEYFKCHIDSGNIFFRVEKVSHGFGINDVARISMTKEDGKKITATPRYVKQELYTYAPFITQEEYVGKFMPASITSTVDKSVLESVAEFPFSFSFIMGKTKNFAEVYQNLDPKKSYTSPDAYLSEKVIAIGDEIRVNGGEYFKACYNGKAFFIAKNKVRLLPDAILNLDTLKRCSPQIRDAFFNHTLMASKLALIQTIEDNFARVNSYSKYGLAIAEWNVYDMSEYTDGTGVRFQFYNPTNSMIKYITIVFQGYNAVDDPVGRPITKKCIGPIDPGDFATYKFDYAWLTDIVDYAKIKSITVQYKNGTTKTISNAKNIEFPEELNEWIESNDPVEKLK